MAAATATNTIIKGVSHNQRGKATTYSATWLVQCTNPVVGYVAQILGQAQSTNRLPQYGQSMLFTSGDGIVVHTGDQYADESVSAFDFTATQDIPGEWRDWRIQVGWRQPQPGEDAEQPDSTDQKPLSRPPRYTIEYRNSTEIISQGRQVISFTGESDSFVAFPKRIMNNTAGHAFPEVERSIIRPVLVIRRNVNSPLVALDINAQFENTTNKEDFTLTFRVGNKKFPLTIKAYRARFLIAEVSEVQHELSQRFVKQELRIELSKTPYFLERLSEGPGALTGKLVIDGISMGKLRYNIPRYTDGTPRPGPFALTITGEEADTLEDRHVQKFLTLGEEDYNILL